MSREIKFRAWDEDRKKMIYKFSEKLNGKAYVLFWNERLFCGNYIDNGDWQEPKLMQFTGRHDKDGEEVYDGDILKYSDGSDVSHHKIYFDVREGRWMDERLEDGDSSIIHDGFDFITDCKKIGNVYENPELLRQ